MNTPDEPRLIELAQLARALFPEGKYHFLIAIMRLKPTNSEFAEIQDTVVMGCCEDSTERIKLMLHEDEPESSESVRVPRQ